MVSRKPFCSRLCFVQVASQSGGCCPHQGTIPGASESQEVWPGKYIPEKTKMVVRLKVYMGAERKQLVLCVLVSKGG